MAGRGVYRPADEGNIVSKDEDGSNQTREAQKAFAKQQPVAEADITEKDVEDLLGFLDDTVCNLVDDEESVKVSVTCAKRMAVFEVRVSPHGDFGKVIGHHGVHAEAIRLLMKSMGKKLKVKTFVEIIDPQGRNYEAPAPSSPTAPRAAR